MHQRLNEILMQRKVDLIHSAYVVDTLYQQQKLGKYCDLKVLVGDKQYFVHRCILAAASAQLDSQINGLDTIQLVGVTYYGFECLLEILYSGKLHGIASLSDGSFQQIVSAADALNAETVMEYCTRERGDLMAILLQRSSAANTETVKSERLPQTSTMSEDGHPPSVLESPQESHTNISVKTELSEPVTSLHEHTNFVPKPEGHIPPRAPAKVVEQEYVEAPVAAEVEVGNFHVVQQQSDTNLPNSQTSKEGVQIMPYIPAPQYTEGNSQSNDQYEEEEYDLETSLTCRVCAATFPNSAALKIHMHSHIGEKIFRCEICGLHFKFQELLWKHKETHKTETVCTVCGEDMKIPKLLQNHIQESHPELLGPQYQVEGNSLKTNRFPRKRTGITPSMERNKRESLISPVVVNDIMRGENGKYQCPLCDRGFDRRWNLKCHVLIHTAAKKGPSGVGDFRYLEGGFSCPECNKPFRNLHNLRRHASSIHGMNASDLAEASDANSRGEYTGMTPHRKPRVQQARKPESSQEEFKFWCSICGRGFKRNRNLRGHMESHQSQTEGLPRYDCHVCGRRFAQKESLNGHLWVHGGKNEDVNNTMEVTSQPASHSIELQSTSMAG